MILTYKTSYKLIFKNLCQIRSSAISSVSFTYTYIYDVLLRELVVKQDSRYSLRITVVPTKNNKYSTGIQMNCYGYSDKEENVSAEHTGKGWGLGAMSSCVNYHNSNFKFHQNIVKRDDWSEVGPDHSAFLTHSQLIQCFWPTL